MGPTARRLLASVELRLLARALATSVQLALAGLVCYLLLAAALLALASPGWVLAADLFASALPIVAALALCAALIPLARRPGRSYLAVLAERTCPDLAGALVLLAEEHPALDPGVLQLSAERAEKALKGRTAREVLRRERRSRAGPATLCATLLAGTVLVFAGGERYLDALGEVTGAWGSGPTRITEVSPGDVVLEEGQLLDARCRVTGRRPQWVRIAFRDGETTPLAESPDGGWRAQVVPTGGSYRIEVGARDGLLPSGSFSVRLRPRPGLVLAGVVYHYPEYTGLQPRRLESAGIDCLQGTRVEVLLRSQGSVAGAALRFASRAPDLRFERAEKDLWKAGFTVRRVGSYSVHVKLADGREREALRGSITARKDLPPTAAASARELENGRIAVDYRLTDDYRLARARMVFRAGGRDMAFAVPDVSGTRESQGTVLVPREVLRAAGSGGFRYRLVARDTRVPEANVGRSPEFEFRPAQRLAMVGPMLEKRRPPRGASRPPLRHAGGAAPEAGPTTRPLESLHKPDLEEKQPPDEERSDPGRSSDVDNEFVSPRGEEVNPRPKRPKKNPDGGGDDPGKRSPDAGGEGRTGDAPEDAGDDNAGGRAPTPGGGTTTTPGNEPTSRPGRGPGSNQGTQPGGEKPPKGHESGSRTPPPEQVIPGEVRMGLEPGEALDGRQGRPGALHTDWGTTAVRGPGSSLAPGRGRAPQGPIGTLRPGSGTRSPTGPVAGTRAPVAPQYRRYVAEYLRAMAGTGN